MKVVSIVGARPQLVKLAPVADAFAGTGHRHVIVHTGQHYDPGLSDVFFAGLGIPAPDVHLGIGSGGHGAQTGAALAALDPVLEAQAPDWVLVYGDTNSTLAGALSAVKQHRKVAHLEAGLRSFNRRMPEEHNRVLTDHCADLLLAPTERALRHLADEGLAGRSRWVGDVMVEVCLRTRDAVLEGRAPAPPLPDGVRPGEPFLLASLHRPDNTDRPDRLGALLDRLAGLPLPVVLPAHPRLVERAARHGLALRSGALRPARPLPYAELVAAVLASSGVVTDSGGLQKEAFLLGRPCTTVRPETEWVETLAGGWNVLADPQAMPQREWAALATRPAPEAERGTPFGDRNAAARVIDLLEEHARD